MNWSCIQDLPHSLWILRKHPGFSIAAIATLALGIGTNTAIFSVVNAVLLNPLTYPAPDRIVQFQLTSPSPYPVAFASIPKFRAWSEQTNIFQDVTGYDFGGSRLNLTGGDTPEQIGGIRVTASYFPLFGVPIERGRAFNAGEDAPNGPHVVVIGDSLWRRRYGADPNIVGKPIQLGGEPYTIIGVIGRKFVFDESPDVWIPFQLDLGSVSQAYFFVAAGRLKTGVTLAQANARLKLTADEFRRRFPGSVFMGPQDGFSVEPLQESMVKDVRSSLLILMGAVSLVLLIACANVANLLLIRTTGRSREIAIRVAVGAGRGRIIRQLLTESVVLSSIGGALGLALGMAAVPALLAINPGDIPRLGNSGALTLDWRVFAFTTAISLGTGIVFGLIPALGASRVDLSGMLKEGSGRTGSGFRRNKARSVLVSGEVALAIMLLIGAALLIRTLVGLRSVNPGFESHNVLTMPMSISGPRFQKTAAVAQLVSSGIERLEAVPGVGAAGVTHRLPLEGAFNSGVTIPGGPPASGSPTVGWNPISPYYFEIYRIPVLKGRAFTVRDNAASLGVAIINDALRKRFFGDRDPLGELIVLGKGGGPDFEEPARQIVGVVSDIHERGLGAAPRPNVYVPIEQITDGMTAQISRTGPVVWVIRTAGDPNPLASVIRNELRKATGLPVAGVRTMDEVVTRSTASETFNMLLMTIFGCSALLLAAIGIYGLMAYSVQQRTRELGIRMALGARAGALRNSIIFQGMRLALVGVLFGTAAAFGLTRSMAFLLWGVKPWDPLAFVAVPAILGAVAFVAVWFPAVRATRIDPMIALRYE